MIRALHQIEISSRCTLACPYCVHPIMTRPKQDMDETTYTKCLTWAARFGHDYAQNELNLAGTGESLMHPKFIEFLDMARKAVGPDMQITFTTNGTLMTEEVAEALSRNDVNTWLTLHHLDIASKALYIMRRHLSVKLSAHPAISPMNWAGQVDWPVDTPRSECMWPKHGWMFAASNGDILRCCQDGSGIGKIGTIDDDLNQIPLNRYALCDKCVWEY